MLTLEEIGRELEDRKLTVVAEKTGLHYQTVWRYASGEVKQPSYDVVKRLAEYLSKDCDNGRFN